MPIRNLFNTLKRPPMLRRPRFYDRLVQSWQTPHRENALKTLIIQRKITHIQSHMTCARKTANPTAAVWEALPTSVRAPSSACFLSLRVRRHLDRWHRECNGMWQPGAAASCDGWSHPIVSCVLCWRNTPWNKSGIFGSTNSYPNMIEAGKAIQFHWFSSWPNQLERCAVRRQQYVYISDAALLLSSCSNINKGASCSK